MKKRQSAWATDRSAHVHVGPKSKHITSLCFPHSNKTYLAGIATNCNISHRSLRRWIIPIHRKPFSLKGLAHVRKSGPNVQLQVNGAKCRATKD
jgi:hypothetical protein